MKFNISKQLHTIRHLLMLMMLMQIDKCQESTVLRDQSSANMFYTRFDFIGKKRSLNILLNEKRRLTHGPGECDQEMNPGKYTCGDFKEDCPSQCGDPIKNADLSLYKCDEKLCCSYPTQKDATLVPLADWAFQKINGNFDQQFPVGTAEVIHPLGKSTTYFKFNTNECIPEDPIPVDSLIQTYQYEFGLFDAAADLITGIAITDTTKFTININTGEINVKCSLALGEYAEHVKMKIKNINKPLYRMFSAPFKIYCSDCPMASTISGPIGVQEIQIVKRSSTIRAKFVFTNFVSDPDCGLIYSQSVVLPDIDEFALPDPNAYSQPSAGTGAFRYFELSLSLSNTVGEYSFFIIAKNLYELEYTWPIQVKLKIIWDCEAESINGDPGTIQPFVHIFEVKATIAEEIRIPITSYDSSQPVECPMLQRLSIVSTPVNCANTGLDIKPSCSACSNGSGCKGNCKWISGNCFDNPVTSIAINVSRVPLFDGTNWYFTVLDSTVLGSFTFRIYYETAYLKLTTQEISFDIVCLATTSTITIPPFTLVQNVYALSPSMNVPWPEFTIPSPTSSIPACVIIDIIQTTNNANPSLGFIPELQVNAINQGTVQAIKMINKQQTGTYMFYIRVQVENANYLWTINQVTLIVECGPQSTEIVIPTPLDGEIQYLILSLGVNINFIFQSQSSNVYCPITSQQVSTTQGIFNPHPDFGLITLISPGNYKIQVNTILVGQIKFYIYAEAEGGASIFSPEFIIQQLCDDQSTVITSPQILPQTNDVLYIELQLEDFEYIYNLNPVLNSNTFCPIEQFDLVDVSQVPLTQLQTTFVGDPISIKLTYSPNKVYKFRVRSVAKGGAEGFTDDITVFFNKLPYFVENLNLTIYYVQLPIKQTEYRIFKFPETADPEGSNNRLSITKGFEFIKLNQTSNELYFEISTATKERFYEIEVMLEDEQQGFSMHNLTFQIVFIPLRCEEAMNLTYPILNKIMFTKNYQQLYTINDHISRIINNQFSTECPIKNCELKNDKCNNQYQGKKLWMNETYPFAINATENYKSGYTEIACIHCENIQQKFDHIVTFVYLQDQKIKPIINGTLQEVVQVELLKNVTYSLPGILKELNVDGDFDTVAVSDVQLGKLQLNTKVIRPIDIYENSVIFQFLLNQTNNIGKNYTIAFQLQSSNGLKSDVYSFIVHVLKPPTNITVYKSISDDVTVEESEEIEEVRIDPSLKSIKKVNQFWRDRSPINMNISDFNNAGVLTLSFEKNITMRDISEINPSSLEVVVLVNSNKTNQTKSQYDFYNCTEFLWYQAKLQIMFYEPLHVSHGGIDLILVRVKNESLFVLNSTQSSTRMMQEEILIKQDSVPKYYQIVAQIPKQLSDPEFALRYQNMVQSVKAVTEASMIMVVGTNMLMAGGMYLIWGMVNTLQMIVYLPLCMVEFPQNVVLLYSILLPLSSLDIIPQEISTDVLFSMSDEPQAPSQRLEEMGFETRNVILNLGSMFYFVAFLQFFIIFVYCNKKKKHQKCDFKCSRKIRKTFSIKDLMNNLFMLYFEATVEVLLSMYLNLDQSIIVTESDKFAYGLGYFLMFPFFIVIPLVIIFVISKSPDELKLPVTRKKWGLIYLDLNVNSKIQLFQSFMYMFRRYVLIFVLYNSYFRAHISIQILTLMYLNCIVTFYTAAAQPYETKARNYSELYNEITILTMTECMILYTDILEPEQQSMIGYMSIVFFLMNLTVNLVIVIYKTYRQIKIKLQQKNQMKMEKELKIIKQENKVTVTSQKPKSPKTKNSSKTSIKQQNGKSIKTSKTKKKEVGPARSFAENVIMINTLNIETAQHISQQLNIEDIIKKVKLNKSNFPSKNQIDQIKPYSMEVYQQITSLRERQGIDAKTFNDALLLQLQSLIPKEQKPLIKKQQQVNIILSDRSFGVQKK